MLCIVVFGRFGIDTQACKQSAKRSICPSLSTSYIETFYDAAVRSDIADHYYTVSVRVGVLKSPYSDAYTAIYEKTAVLMMILYCELPTQ